MTNTNNKFWMWVATYAFALLLGMLFTLPVRAQVLSNRTPDKAKIYASPTPTPTPSPGQAPVDGSILYPDPALLPPDVRGPRREPVTVPAYYITLRAVNSLLVSDAQGRVDDLFPAGVAFKVLEEPTYNVLGTESYLITLPIDESYSITFESEGELRLLEILKGRGNTSPDEAIRYLDLDLQQKKARIQITPQGVGPLLLDANRDGVFESLIKPTIKLSGVPARDTHGPVVKFKVIERTATMIVIAIKAIDSESGLKDIYYSTDGLRFIPYKSPVRVKLSAEFIWALADDNVANRTTATFDFNRP
jgi:hypothetical protein